jgi:hypothetical protein
MIPRNWWIVTIAAFFCMLFLAWCAHACEATGRAVLAKGAMHATWTTVDGRRCWVAGYPGAARLGPLSPNPRVNRQSARIAVPLPPIDRRWGPLTTQRDTDAAWRRYDDAVEAYNRASMFLNLLLFGTMCPLNNGECSFGGPDRPR